MNLPKPMYQPVAYSPVTAISAAIGAWDTTITVNNGALLGDAPNIAVIGVSEDNSETIIYGSKNGNVLSNVQRGIQGTAKSWSAGDPIARNFTALDQSNMQENITAISSKFDTLTKLRTIYVATEDGNDGDMGSTRANSVKTIARALALVSHDCTLVLYIHKYKTAAPAAYASDTNYAVGDRCTSGGYTFERVTAGTGTTPSVAATEWRFVPISNPSKGDFNSSAAYAVGDTVSWNNGTQTLTHICMTAQAAGAAVSPANTTTKYWALCGYHNPVIPSTTIQYYSGLCIYSESSVYDASQPKVICTAGIDLSQNGYVSVGAQLNVAGALTLNLLSTFLLHGPLTANVIISTYSSDGRFNSNVGVFAYLSHSTGEVVYYGAVNVNTNNLTSTGITAGLKSHILFYNTLTVNGFNDGKAANTGIGIYSRYSGKITTYGNVTVNGFGTAIQVSEGAEYRNNSAATTLSKGTNIIPDGNTTAIKIDARSLFVSSKGSSYIRTNTVDDINSAGVFFDYKNTDVSTINIALADNTGSTALAATATGPVTTKLQSFRDNLKQIFAYFTGNAANLAVKLQKAQSLKVKLDSTKAVTFDGSEAQDAIPVTGTLAVGNGGTGITIAPSMLTNLETTTAASPLANTPRPGVTGILPVKNGGTGAAALTGLVKAKGTEAFSAAEAGKDYLAPAALDTITDNTLYSVTSGTVGHLVKTTITNTEIGNVIVNFRGSCYTTAGMFDTELNAFVNAGTITANSFQQMDRGTGMGAASAFIDTDNTWTFFFPHNVRYLRTDIKVTLRTTTAYGTASAYSAVPLTNRCKSITAATSATKPKGTETSYMKVPISRQFSVSLTKSRTIYVATEDGDDTDIGTSRAASVKTIAQALALVPHDCTLILYIHKYKTAAPAPYNSATTYAVGARVTSGGYTYERMIAGRGTTPGVTLTEWKFVPAAATKGAFNAAAAYAVGDIVSWNNGTQTVTFICMTAQTAGSAVAPPTSGTTKYWTPCGIDNPVIGSTTINNYSGLQLWSESSTYNAAQPRVICTAGMNLSNNEYVNIGTSLSIAETLTLDRLANYYFAVTITANVITSSYSTEGRFNGNVAVFAYISHTGSDVVYYGAVTVYTDNLTRAGVTSGLKANVLFYNTLKVNGFNDSKTANTGIGIYTRYSGKITTYGDVTVNGLGTAIQVSEGAEYRNNSATTTLSKEFNTVPVGNTTAIKIDARSLFVSSKGSSYTRNNTVDAINVAGAFFDFKNTDVSTINITLADNAGSTALAATTTAPITTKLQSFRDNIKQILSYFTGGAANLAVKLKTQQSLKVKLDSTKAVTFDGSEPQDAIPVTGTLAVANGGTGVATLTGLVKAKGTDAFSAAVAGTDYLAPAALDTITDNTLYSVTSGTVGHLIKTTITNTEIGNVVVNFRGSCYTTVGMFDSELNAFVNAGTITANSFQQMDRGTGMGAASAFIDTDNTWTFFFPHNVRYLRTDIKVTLRTTTAFGTASAYNAASLTNRCKSITAATSATKPKGTETSYMKVPISRQFSVSLTKSRTIYVATEDGDDTDIGTSRATSVKTIAQALALVPHDCTLILYIHKYKTAAPAAYSSSVTYAVGDRVTSVGHTYERVTAGNGTTPALTSTVWKFVPIPSTSKGVFSTTAAYAVGDTISWNNGTQTVTYVCTTAQPSGSASTPVNGSSKYWIPCGIDNPIIGSTTISDYSGVQIYSESSTCNSAQPRVICTSSINLSNNGYVNIGCNLGVAGTLTLDRLASFYFAGFLAANVITSSYSAEGIFNNTIGVFAYISHTASEVVYYGATTINTDNLTRAGVTSGLKANVLFYNNLTVNGFNDGKTANTGIGIYTRYSGKITTYGDVTVNSLGTAIQVSEGAEYRNNSATTILSKESNIVPAGNTTAIKIDARSLFVSSKGSSYTRTNTVDAINASGVFYDFKNMDSASAINLTLADNAASAALPTTASGSLVSKIQALRDNVKQLFDTKRDEKYSLVGSVTNASYPWYKVASLEVSAVNTDHTIVFHVSGAYTAPQRYGILYISCAVGSTMGTRTVRCEWELIRGYNASNFMIRHNGSASPAVFELWFNNTVSYDRVVFRAISEGSRASHISGWQLYRNLVNGETALPANGYTEVVSTVTGNAGTATTLQTARTIQSDLASTTAVSFNGAADVTPGVKGILPVRNGGTGAATITGLVMAKGTDAFSAATPGTDYVVPSSIPKNNWTATIDPKTSDYSGYMAGSNWYNKNTGGLFICVAVSGSTATWVAVTNK